MSRLLIEGGARLNGKVNISGFKNAAVAIIPATLLSGDKCIVDNLPLIRDVFILKDIMKDLGAEIELNDDGVMTVDTSMIKKCNASSELSQKLRASYYLLGAGLARFKEVEVAYPGGCNIGNRPIDQHIKGFEALGAKVEIEHGIIRAKADKLTGAKIYLDIVSVGATINIMLAAVMAEGKTIIENAAKEPHIVDVANFLNSMGADIRGAGTDIIKINGVKELHGCTYSVIPDQIEAGTYMIAAAATKGDVVIDNVIPKHLEPVTAKLRELGVEVVEYGDSIRVTGTDKIKSANIKTLPYPGFPTDLQQPMTVLLTQAEGTSIVTESIFEGRFKYVDELKRMGAKIKVEGRTAVVEGPKQLSSAKVMATDLRAGAAFVIAGLISDGVTEIGNIYHVDRGYEKIEYKLMNLGAKIKRIEE
ncbi:UDP-N-acetylglucosamine 1-carboxyvinyltransferase [Caldisalinibacter kiritimatiensis]|uniref:UDP-N-acetylglucosamine 1-carboxyvinyltransferase n=1 Tax=Caldisalinibacter kiritimatiensis TaxID=1304284 RepID=R1CU24_9FIRM|nr:UDP-N-acetylglucosamine 1-carboxyvinyltransferase [Caldisalinibacter kiritimatiensis]EOD00189.1 UDP-N-acetylglucosamine 1-carboxyvinyltransferase [Caldisalinibacter kiritimatiensis]